MIGAGQLNRRLTLQAPVETPDDQGGVARSYATFATVWASVTPLDGQTKIEADAEGATERYRIVLRSHFSLTLQHRLVEGERIYRIVGIRDRDNRRFVEIDTEVRVE